MSTSYLNRAYLLPIESLHCELTRLVAEDFIGSQIAHGKRILGCHGIVESVGDGIFPE